MLKRLMVTGLLVSCVSGAGAAIIVQPPTISGNDWNYEIDLDPGVFLKNDNFFTVYDFQGLQGTPVWTPDVAVNDWKVDEAGTGRDPNKIKIPNDDPTLLNVTVTYTGATQFPAPGTDRGTGLLKLGTLTLTGLVGEGAPQQLLTYGSNSSQNDSGALFGHSSATFGPTAVPEPSTVGLMVAGLAVVGTLVRRRIKQS